ncbi:MAG: hypothetical protein JSS99_01290 [Actinobacteria bacterium]|nr:hypothetical protein [Actinomycetota bacterium]
MPDDAHEVLLAGVHDDQDQSAGPERTRKDVPWAARSALLGWKRALLLERAASHRAEGRYAGAQRVTEAVRPPDSDGTGSHHDEQEPAEDLAKAEPTDLTSQHGA